MVDDEVVVEGAGDVSAISASDWLRSLVAVGTADSRLSSGTDACGAAVDRSGSGIADKALLPRDASSGLDSRLVMLNQLAGLALVFAWGRRVVGAPSGPAGFRASLTCKADLSLLNSMLTFLSPEKVINDFLLSWSRIGFLFFSSCDRRLFCLPSLFLSSSSLFFRLSSSLRRCLSASRAAAFDLSSWGMNPEGYETMCIECGRRWRGPMCGAGRLGLAPVEKRRARRSAELGGV